jgi:flagellar motor switch protein FliN/FliY
MADEEPPPTAPDTTEETPAEASIPPPEAAETASAPTLDAEATPDDATAATAVAEPPLDESTTTTASEIEELLKQGAFEDPSAMVSSAAAPGVSEFKLPNIQQVMQDAQVSSIDLLRDVELNVKIELGRSRMLVEDVLKLAEGSVVELDKLAGDPVDVFVNDRLVARGEVLVLNDNFCVRVNEIVAGVKEEGT